MRNTLIALFGGSGQRFGLPYPKQFALVDARPLFVDVLDQYQNLNDINDILVVSEPSTLDQAKKLCDEYRLTKVIDVIPGGDTRQQSSYLGLKYLIDHNVDPATPVVIVDGDRPCVQKRYVTECLAMLAPNVGAVVAIPSTDSLLLGESGLVKSYMPRKDAYRVQTPQAFLLADIYNAHKASLTESFTDDASIALKAGMDVHIVLGDETNIKITTPEDLELYKQWKTKRA